MDSKNLQFQSFFEINFDSFSMQLPAYEIYGTPIDIWNERIDPRLVVD